MTTLQCDDKNENIPVEAHISPIVKDDKLEPKSFKCSFPGCNLSYSRQWKLERHFCSHTGLRPFRCEENGCNKTYQCNSHLQRHVRTAHSKFKVFLPCMYPNCKATFTRKSSLLKHCKNHGKARAFQCSVCQVSFQKAQRLAQHEMSHSNVLPFSCAVCKSGWASNTLLKRHMRSHALLQCEYENCTEVCQSRSLMRKHIKVAHRVVLTCDQCQKSFNNKGILRDHVLTHFPRGQRGVLCCPFVRCDRVYLQMRNLRHHIKVFHGSPRYYCDYKSCPTSFISKVRLRKHIVLKHGLQGKLGKAELIKNLTTIAPMIEEDASEPASTKESKEEQFMMVVMSRDHF